MPSNRDPLSEDETLPGGEGFDPDEPDADEDDEDAEDGEHRVAHKPDPLPTREQEEAELAEADIVEHLDLDDLERMDGPDA
jgi:hypothetical protein